MTVCPGCGELYDQPQCPSCAKASGKRRGPTMTIVEFIIVLGLISVLAAILMPNFVKARARGQLTSCKSNLKNTATALEMYSTDYAGHYPPAMSLLIPKYLKVIPNCPYAQRDTYSGTYQVHAEPDAFSLYCAGKNHRDANIRENYPEYNSFQSVLER